MHYEDFWFQKVRGRFFFILGERWTFYKNHCLRTSIGGTTKQYRKFNTIWKKHSNNFALFGSHLPQSFTDISNHFGGIFKSQTVTRNTIDLKNTVAQLYENYVCISMHLDLGHPFGGILRWWEIFLRAASIDFLQKNCAKSLVWVHEFFSPSFEC